MKNDESLRARFGHGGLPPKVRVRLIDQDSHQNHAFTSNTHGRYAPAMLLIALAAGRRSFVMSAEERDIAAAFFAEFWDLNDPRHRTINFLRNIPDARIEVVWDAEQLISEAFQRRGLMGQKEYQLAVDEAVRALDDGLLRAAVKQNGEWTVNAWVKQAILLYFATRDIKKSEAGPLHFADKIPIKTPPKGVRVVPPGTIRYGAYVAPGSIVMPGYVNIGAYVDTGTMVDTWATVGSCAQIGRDVHLSGGVGIGGVLEPPSARPVIIEDGAFVGSRTVIVEGMLVEQEAVIGAGVVLTASTRIIDVTCPEPIEFKGRIPAYSVVIPGTIPKRFPAGEYGVPCALIIGQRTASTNRKTSLEQALREFSVPV